MGLAGAENRVVRGQVRRQGQGEQQSMHRLQSIAAKGGMGVDVFKVRVKLLRRIRQWPRCCAVAGGGSVSSKSIIRRCGGGGSSSSSGGGGGSGWGDERQL